MEREGSEDGDVVPFVGHVVAFPIVNDGMIDRGFESLLESFFGGVVSVLEKPHKKARRVSERGQLLD